MGGGGLLVWPAAASLLKLDPDPGLMLYPAPKLLLLSGASSAGNSAPRPAAVCGCKGYDNGGNPIALTAASDCVAPVASADGPADPFVFLLFNIKEGARSSAVCA